MIALAAFCTFLSAQKPESIASGNIAFSISPDASGATFSLEQIGEVSSPGADFWRLILDDGLRTEIPILSHSQTGRVRVEGDSMLIEYDSLISEYGDQYPIRFTVEIRKKGKQLLSFSS